MEWEKLSKGTERGDWIKKKKRKQIVCSMIQIPRKFGKLCVYLFNIHHPSASLRAWGGLVSPQHWGWPVTGLSLIRIITYDEHKPVITWFDSKMIVLLKWPSESSSRDLVPWLRDNQSLCLPRGKQQCLSPLFLLVDILESWRSYLDI